MQLSVTFRHMDSTDALSDYAREKVERIRKYFPDPIKAHVVLVCDRGYNHIADVMITLHNGLVIKGVETTEDMYSSIDLVMAKIERQVPALQREDPQPQGLRGAPRPARDHPLGARRCRTSEQRRARPTATAPAAEAARSSRSRSSSPSRCRPTRRSCR